MSIQREVQEAMLQETPVRSNDDLNGYDWFFPHVTKEPNMHAVDATWSC